MKILSNLAVFALNSGTHSGVREVKRGLCFNTMTQHSVKQADTFAQGVILTIWSNMSGWAAQMQIFKS